MPETRQLLVVAHAPSANTRTLTDAIVRGASAEDIEHVAVRRVKPLEAAADDVLGADAIILGTTTNFGYMSGALKDFFDRIYYPCLEHTERLPYALFVHAGNDPTGARTSVERIVSGLKWRAVQPPLLTVGERTAAHVAACEELGMTVAAGLDAGLY